MKTPNMKILCLHRGKNIAFWELQRWLSGEEFIGVSQSTRVQFPASMSSHPNALSWPLWELHSCVQILTAGNIRFFFFKDCFLWCF